MNCLVLLPLLHDGARFEPGCMVELSPAQASPLLALGWIEVIPESEPESKSPRKKA